MSIPAGVVGGMDSLRLAERGIPTALTRGNAAAYLLAIIGDRDISVTAAAARAGLTPAAIRQRRHRDPIFAVAESALREGRTYRPPGAPEQATRPDPFDHYFDPEPDRARPGGNHA